MVAQITGGIWLPQRLSVERLLHPRWVVSEANAFHQPRWKRADIRTHCDAQRRIQTCGRHRGLDRPATSYRTAYRRISRGLLRQV